MKPDLGFEYDKVADLVNPQAASDKAINEGFELPETVLKLNAKARTAETEDQKRFQSSLFATIPKIAKADAGRRAQRRERLRNDQRFLFQELKAQGHEVTLDKLQAYRDGKEDLVNETGSLSWIAADIEAKGGNQNRELAEQIRNLTGFNGVIAKEVLIGQAAETARSDIKEAIANNSVKIPGLGPDGGDLTFANSTGTEDDETLINYWLKTEGLNKNNIGGLSSESLTTHYWDRIGKAKALILSDRSVVRVKASKTERENTARSNFLTKANANDGSLGAAIVEFARANAGDYGSRTAAYQWAQTQLLQMLKNRDISAEQFESLYHRKFPHKGQQGKMVSLAELNDVWNPDKNGDLVSQLRTARREAIQAKETDHAIEADRFVSHIKTRTDERGYPLTEAEAATAIAQWQSLPENAGRAVPARINNLLANTLEDRGDKFVVAEMKHRQDIGLPIGTLYEKIKGDGALYKKWKDISESALGQGLNERHYNEANQRIDYLSRDALDLTMGVIQTKSGTYLDLFNNAKALYASEYRNAKFITPDEKHQYAMDQVKNAFAAYKSGDRSLVQQDSLSVNQSYSTNANEALIKLQTGMEANNNNLKKALEGTVILNESDMKQIEAFALNPLTTSLPPICSYLAQNLKHSDSIGLLTDWHVAAAQYRAKTGKELPQPQAIQKLGLQPKFAQYLLTYKTSHNRLRKASIISKGDGDFNIEEAVQPGIQIETAETPPQWNQPPELVPTDSGGNIL